MRRKKVKKGIFLIFLTVFIAACGKNILFTDSADIPDKTWQLTNIPEFRYNSADTTGKTDISFIIRTGSDFPYRNIFLFVTAISPDGRSLTDTLEYDLADEKGRWYGKGSGDVHELRLPWRSNVYFPLKGEYVFRIQHGMRSTGLRGVYDFGLRIEKITI